MREVFPGAMHTLDIMHATEYLWTAAACVYREGSEELAAWVEELKDLLYAGRTLKLVNEISRRLDSLPKRGPANVAKRKRRAVSHSIRDFQARNSVMLLHRHDLENRNRSGATYRRDEVLAPTAVTPIIGA